MGKHIDFGKSAQNSVGKPRCAFAFKVLLCMVVFFLSTLLGAQDNSTSDDRSKDQPTAKLAGKVVDESGGALVGATVILTSGSGAIQARTTTDSFGLFMFSKVPPGRYRVQFEQKQFTTAQVDVSVTDGTGPDPIQAVLKPGSVYSTLEVRGTGQYVVQDATTATKSDALLAEVPVSVSVVPRAVLEDQQSSRIADGLKNVSSVQISGPGTAGNNFLIRGFSNGGVIMRDSLAGVTDQGFRTDFDTYNVDRIEVMKGPSSVLFGRAQPGGVINVVTSAPQLQPFFSVEQVLGSYDQRRTVAHVTGPILPNKKTLLYRIDGVYENSGSFRQFDVNKREAINPRVTWRPGESTDLTISYERAHTNYMYDPGQIAIGNGPANIPITRSLFADSNSPLADFNQSFISTDFTQRLGRGWRLHGRFQRSYRDSSDVEFSAFNGTSPLSADGVTLNRNLFSQVSDTSLYSTNGELLGDFTLKGIRNQVLVGFDFLRDYTDYSAGYLYSTSVPTPALALNIFAPVYGLSPALFSQALDNALNGSHNYSVFWNKNYGTYFQDQVTILGKVHVMVGGRVDSANVARGNGASLPLAEANRPSQIKHDNAFSPRAGLLYQPITWLGLYGSYTSSFSSNNGTSIAFNGDAFPPQRARQYEAGLKTQWFNGNLSTTTAAFSLIRSNITVSDPNHPGYSLLTGEQRSEGVEIETIGKVTSNLSVLASYTWIAKAWVSKNNPLSLGGSLGDLLANVPKSAGNVWLNYSLKVPAPEPVNLGLGVFAAGRREGDLANDFVLPAYGRVDASVGYAFKMGRTKLTARVNVRNLFDKTYYEVAGSRTSVFPGSPRTVMPSVTLAF
jgi:iron complex outermembrane receptor protein